MPLLGAVHINKTEDLFFIKNLVGHGVEELIFDSNFCMTQQVSYSLSSVTGIEVHRLFNHAKKLHHAHNGISVEKLFRKYSQPIKWKGKTYKLSMSVVQYDLQGAIAAVKTGQPVLIITKTYGSIVAAIQKSNRRTGLLRERHFKPKSTWEDDIYHHVMLLTGYDQKDSILILRDTHPYNGAGGFARLKLSSLERYPEIVEHYFAIVVDHMEVT